MIGNALNVQQRLMRHTEYDEASGCWEWVGSKRNGYGRMIKRYNGKYQNQTNATPSRLFQDREWEEENDG